MPASKGLKQFSTHNKNAKEGTRTRTRPRFTEELTGSDSLDNIINVLLELTIRDYVRPWYQGLSTDDHFPKALGVLAKKIIANLNLRVRNVDWTSFLTGQLVDDFASYIRLYCRKATEKVVKNKRPGKKAEDLESLFFDLELEMEVTVCRDLVATPPAYEADYLRDLSDVLMYLLLPEAGFDCKPLRFLLREFLVNKVLLPFVESVSDPDSVNQNIMYLLGDVRILPDEFL